MHFFSINSKRKTTRKTINLKHTHKRTTYTYVPANNGNLSMKGFLRKVKTNSKISVLNFYKLLKNIILKISDIIFSNDLLKLFNSSDCNFFFLKKKNNNNISKFM